MWIKTSIILSLFGLFCHAEEVTINVDYRCDMYTKYVVRARICEEDKFPIFGNDDDCGEYAIVHCDQGHRCYQQLVFDDYYDAGDKFELYLEIDHTCNTEKSAVRYLYPDEYSNLIEVPWRVKNRLDITVPLDNKSARHQ